ncbi:MAG: glycine cleavage system protein H, partial [Planctomycetota bacterium]
PVGGVIVEINQEIEEHLETLGVDPWKKGWLIKIKPTDPSLDHMLDAEAYEQRITVDH